MIDLVNMAKAERKLYAVLIEESEIARETRTKTEPTKRDE